ncbi:hydrogenase expression/formation protein HupK [Azoarcus olearius]|uniref:Hydrogenase expression/formation protein HupK n=1 Tax=Azoarcus sp. (strain BH72) TaxID=418699 RepID=A1KC58_AZOSB|nr:hydrogenase expression/formation protein HupK [Azoarcus olearius]CAL96414.1 putative hydrogenase expression/formation protein HupK [Azoarcus olearius]
MLAGTALQLHATVAGDGRLHATVRNLRPAAARLLVGRRVDEAVALAPRLFALCGCAQGAAARLACRAAAGEAAALDEGDERRLAAEAAHEHLWRLLLDWPVLFGAPPQRQRYADLHRRLSTVPDATSAGALGEELQRLATDELLGGTLPRLQDAASEDAVQANLDAAGTGFARVLAQTIALGTATDGAATPVLPQRSAAAWTTALGGLPDPHFCSAPTEGSNAAETGPLARHAHLPVVALLLARHRRIAARLLAKVIDVADCGARLAGAPGTPLADAIAPAPGLGLACVDTARGTLLHGVRVEAGRIADYRICAPTDWHFHPGGAFVGEVKGRHAADEAGTRLRLHALALSLDPCVAFELSVEDSVHA